VLELPRPRLGDRSLFPALEPFAYLNHAAISPASLAVVRAVTRVAESYAQKGLGAFFGLHDERVALRRELAALVGVEADEVGFVGSTTLGVLAIALSIPWKKGDRVILFEGEFPANVTPWQRVAERFELELELVPCAAFEQSDDAGLELTRAALARGARLLAVSLVEFQTGLRMPVERLAELAHAAGAEVFVDAVQAVGVVPVDVVALGADYLAAGAHKWLMGLEGAGFVVARHAARASLGALFAGWLSHEDGLRFLLEGAGHLRYDRPLKARPEVFEVGNVSAASFAALGASVATLRELGVDAIFEHVTAYLAALEPLLASRGLVSARAREAARQSGILSVRPPPGVPLAGLARELAARGVSVSTPDGYLRFSPHFANDAARELPGLERALDDALAALAPRAAAPSGYGASS
jgi:cysteine desulfurase/selenocysteine lyase